MAPVVPVLGNVNKQLGFTAGHLKVIGLQMPDIVQQLISGQSPFMIMIQQGGQVVQMMMMQQGGLRAFGQAILNAITPARALVGVLGLAAGAGILAYKAWANGAKAIDQLSEQSATAMQRLRGLQGAAGLKGVGDDFVPSMQKFAALVYQAQNNMGPLAEMMRANGMHARTFNEYFDRAADLVRNAATEAQKYVTLQQLGLPATREWVRFLEQGALGIRKATNELGVYTSASEQALVNSVRKWDEGWDAFTTRFGMRWKQAFVGVISIAGSAADLVVTQHTNALTRLAAQAAKMPGALGAPFRAFLGDVHPGTIQIRAGMARGVAAQRGEPELATPAGRTVDPDAMRRNLGLEQQRLGMLGQLATVEQRVRQTTIGITLARLDGVSITAKEQAQLEFLARTQEQGARLSERVSMGLASEIEIRRQLNNELEALKMRGIVKSTEDLANAQVSLAKRLEQTAEAAKIAAAPLEGLKRMQLDAANLRKGLDELATSTLRGVEDALVDFASGTKSAADAFRDMVNSILRDMLRLLIRQSITGPLAGIVGDIAKGNFSFGGASASGLTPTGFMAGGVAHGGVFSRGELVPMRRGGIVTKPTLFPMARGAGLMGEAGPEGVLPLIRTPGGDLGVRAQGGGGTNIFIENHGAEIQQERTPQGDLRLVIHGIESYMADRRARGQGALAKSDRGQLRG